MCVVGLAIGICLAAAMCDSAQHSRLEEARGEIPFTDIEGE